MPVKESGKKKLKFTPRQWLLFSGAVAISVVLFVAGLKMPLVSMFRDTHAQKVVPPAATISLSSDSMAAALYGDTSVSSKMEDLTTKRNGEKPPPQLPDDSAIDFSRETTLRKRSEGNLPSLVDTLAAQLTIAKSELAAQINISVDPWAKIVIDGQETDSHAYGRRFQLIPENIRSPLCIRTFHLR